MRWVQEFSARSIRSLLKRTPRYPKRKLSPFPFIKWIPQTAQWITCNSPRLQYYSSYDNQTSQSAEPKGQHGSTCECSKRRDQTGLKTKAEHRTKHECTESCRKGRLSWNGIMVLQRKKSGCINSTLPGHSCWWKTSLERHSGKHNACIHWPGEGIQM